MVDIREAVIFHLDIEREGGIAVWNLVHSVAEGLGEGAFVHQFQQRTGMDGGDVPVGFILTTLTGSHIVHLTVVHLYPRHAVACHHLTAMFPDDIGQQVGKMAAAPHEPTGTVDIEHADHGMHVCWRMPSPAAVQRVHPGHHAAQPFVLDITGNEVVGCHEEAV